MVSFLWFGSPWILAGLGILPLVWWLLKVTPPPPRQIFFPPLRFLRDLEQTARSSARTPWWLLWLRLMILTLIILGLSGPVIGPDGQMSAESSLILVVDDGWSSASYWPEMKTVLQERLDLAKKQNRPLLFIPTARSLSPLDLAFLPPHQVAQAVEGLEPKPWPIDRQTVAEGLSQLEIPEPVDILWLSDGLEHPGTRELATVLQRLGPLEIMGPEAADWPYLLSGKRSGSHIQATIARLASHRETVRIQAKDAHGHLLIQESLTFDSDQTQAEITLTLPPQQPIAFLNIANHQTAAAVFLLDPRWHRHLIALVDGCRQTEGQPLLRDDHYLSQALSPYATVLSADLEFSSEIVPSAFILADLAPLSTEQQTRLDAWIRQGGILIRFAGPCLAQNPDPLLPVTLRSGERHLGGDFSWTRPAARLSPFPERSPFLGLKAVEEVHVTHQIFTEPSLDLEQKTWAYLEDGTPLITGERREKGYLILIHTTAGPEWSNLALSGLFVQILERLLSLGSGVNPAPPANPLPPLMSLNGFGELRNPFDSAVPFRLTDPIVLGPDTPPGYYGDQDFYYPVNLSAHVSEVRPFQTLPAELAHTSFQELSYFSLTPWLLILALVLSGVDGFVMVLRRFGWFVLAGVLIHSPPLAAEPWKFSLKAHLAYVKTEPHLDHLSQAGLTRLSALINRRTSLKIDSVIGIDPETDAIDFFPLLYWPVSPNASFLSEKSRSNINRYLSHGGMILFDTRDHRLGNYLNTPEKQALKRLTQGLSIPPLQPIPKDHTLTKSFYLLSEFPGRHSGGLLWVSKTQEYQNDEVSAILIGANDWASAWATDPEGKALFSVSPGGERQRELAYRVGINLLMYAMTGNYKSDQIHIEEILKRRKLTQ